MTYTKPRVVAPLDHVSSDTDLRTNIKPLTWWISGIFPGDLVASDLRIFELKAKYTKIILFKQWSIALCVSNIKYGLLLPFSLLCNSVIIARSALKGIP